MPIYEYTCKACGHTLEAMQRISDKPLLICPTCSKPELQKIISRSGFQLKGEGWYVTDFKDAKKESKE
jgi:putative FmdB family regulatory protein